MNYKFELTEDEANVVLAGLGELPAKASLSVIQKIQSQATEQLNQDKGDVSLDAVNIGMNLKEEIRDEGGAE